jgi:CheY-like chemotaxis protein
MTSIKENVEEVASAIGVAAAVLAVDVECPNDFRYIKPAGRRLSRLQNQLEQARTAGSFHTRQTQTVSLDEKKALLNNQPKKVGQSMFSKGYSSVDAMSASTIFTRRNKRTKRLRKLTDKMESSLRQDLQLRPKVHELLPLPVLRKFDVEQAEIAYRRRARPKVLIVDGNLIHLAACKHIFEKRFEVVQCVKSADQALDLVDHIVFDVILVALDLPGDLSGLDLVDALRHVEQQSKFAFRTLVLAMLTKEQEKDRTVLDACFCSGMDRFLMKPAVHTVHTIADLLTSGDSLDTFRRLTLETHWISNHGGMIDLLQGDIAKAKAIQAIVEEERTEERLQREAEAMMDDQGQQHAVKKLHDRQQIEDLNRIISATTQLRRQNEELRHRITELEEEKARNTAVENRNVDALVVLEKRVVAAEREIHEKNRESEHLRLEAEHHRADLKNLLDNGCINAQMVKQAKQRVASFQRRMEANEKLAMESHDTMCKRMWFNYYGNAGNRGRADVGQFVPRFAVDTAATWYRTELNQLISVVGNVMQDSANVIDQSRLTLSRFVDIEFPEVDAVCNVARDQMQLVTKRTTSDLNKLRNAVEDCVAAVLVREISFWKFFEDEERSLREELRSIKAYIADKQQKLIDASASTQTNTPTWDVFLPTFDGMFRKTVEGISEKLDSDSCPPEIMEPISQFYHRLPSHIQRCANTSAVARCLLTLTPLLFDEQVYSVRVRTSAFYAVMERIIELEEQAAYARRRSPSTRLSSMEDLTDGRRVELDPASDSDHLGLEGESNMITGGTSGVFVHSTPLGEPTPETKPLVRRRSRKSVVSTADDSKEKQNDSKDGKGSRKSSTTTGGRAKVWWNQ